MRTAERQARAWNALLKQAETGRLVTFTSRGLSDTEAPLYEVKVGKEILVLAGNERTVMQALEPKETK